MKYKLLLLAVILSAIVGAWIDEPGPCTSEVPTGSGRWVSGCIYIHADADRENPNSCQSCHGIPDPLEDTQIRIDTRTDKPVALYDVEGDLCLIGTGEWIDCGWLWQPLPLPICYQRAGQ